MKILILEDEIPAYEKIRSYIVACFPQAEIIGWARTNEEGRNYLLSGDAIDLIFSDIELLDGLSIDLFEEVKTSIPIIFCTAFDQYLLRAFQNNGISYMLKPYDEEGFRQAVEKYQSLFSAKESTPYLDPSMIQELKSALSSNHQVYKRRFSIKKNDGIVLVHTDEVVMIEANGDFCFLHDASGRRHICNSSLGDLEQVLDPNNFFRINRSEIVQITYIEKIDQHFKNRLLLTMKGMGREVFTSGTKTPLFRKWIDQ